MIKKLLNPQKKEIQFHLVDNFHKSLGGNIAKPEPTSHFIPDWYKKIPKGSVDVEGSSRTVKACMPVKDLMTAGYIIPHWQNARIKDDEDKGKVVFNTPFPQYSISHHSEDQIKGCPLTRVAVLKFESPWIVETPPGYSCLFIQPVFNELNNDLTMLSAIVDTDKYYYPVNFPFLYHPKNTETHIQAGDSMIQVIPFKRESWLSSVITKMTNKSIEKKNDFNLKCFRHFQNRYLKESWTPKYFK
jgi:hypothetical protein